MLIFGTYVIHRTLGEGHMMCPQCMGVTAYRVRRGRWFFHVLFIPLIPMRRTPAHVECLTCRSRFALGVLGPDAAQYRDGSTPPPLEQMMQPPSAPGAPGAPVVPPPPVSLAAPAPQRNDALALARGLTTQVLRRAAPVTDAGVAAAVDLIRSRGVDDVRSEYVRHDLANLDAGYLRDLVRSGVGSGAISASAARDLVADAVRLAHRNGALTAAQWDWIVAFGLDAGVGPTASAETRDSVLARG
jgi:hypothetical protein